MIEELKEAIGTVYAFISQFVDLDDKGRGHCPFHPPDLHPSFAVNRQEDYWVDFHDQTGGSERGTNIIFTFEVDGIRLTHLGDLGHSLSDEKLADLEGTDILFAPTGGPGATLELDEIMALWDRLRPRMVIPMHFRTEKCQFPKYGIEDLVKERPETVRAGKEVLSISWDELPDPVQIYVLEHSR